VVDGGTGADVLRSRDNWPDLVECGADADAAIADPLDELGAE
jgi:hypothetical protein